MPAHDLADVIGDDYCYLTTTGRRSGLPREIEIWFGLEGLTLYLLAGSGERAQWVRNLRTKPAVSVRLRDHTYRGRARVVSDPVEDAAVRRMLVEKYQPRSSGDLAHWGKTALPVAVDLSSDP